MGIESAGVGDHLRAHRRAGDTMTTTMFDVEKLAEIFTLQYRLQRMELEAEAFGRSDERTVRTSEQVSPIVYRQTVEMNRGLMWA